MTNHALDALDILWSDKANAHLSYEELKAAYDTIRTALANAPEVVTPVEFDKITMANYMSDVGLNETEFLMKRFPHGLKITAAPNGGA